MGVPVAFLAPARPFSVGPLFGGSKLAIDRDQFQQQWFRRFGSANPERMNVPFWMEQVRSKEDAYAVRKKFHFDPDGPVWCFDRYGMSRTLLPDGRVIYIAGEHEDGYDPDFCIYNDVVLEHLDGSIDIFGYPRELFPPTDFHTATLINDSIYVIGTLGYVDERRPGETPVYRLDVDSMAISFVETTGENPGWLFKHEAVANTGGTAIFVWGGELYSEPRVKSLPNWYGYGLDLRTMKWMRLEPSAVVRSADENGRFMREW
jgi:hypothetical protein